MHADLSSKVVVVTGAAQGIGRALALGLAGEGARIVAVARDREPAHAVVDEIAGLAVAEKAIGRGRPRRRGRRPAGSGRDRRGLRPHRRVHQQRRVDAADVPGAGHRPCHAGTRLAFERRELLPHNEYYMPLLLRNGGGRIVYMSSAIGTQAGPGLAPYGGTKAAVNRG